MNSKRTTGPADAVIALQFDGVNAPVVTAKGSGAAGEKIIQLAKEHGIPLHENADLANALSHIPMGDAIPYELYAIVAEVLAFVYTLDEERSPL